MLYGPIGRFYLGSGDYLPNVWPGTTVAISLWGHIHRNGRDTVRNEIAVIIVAGRDVAASKKGMMSDFQSGDAFRRLGETDE